MSCPQCAGMSAEQQSARDWPNDFCRWCGKPSDFSWQFEGEPHPDPRRPWRLQADWEVCERCHDLALANQGTELVERIVTTLVDDPDSTSNSTGRRQVEADRVEYWARHRTTYRRKIRRSGSLL